LRGGDAAATAAAAAAKVGVGAFDNDAADDDEVWCDETGFILVGGNDEDASIVLPGTGDKVADARAASGLNDDDDDDDDDHDDGDVDGFVGSGGGGGGGGGKSRRARRRRQKVFAFEVSGVAVQSVRRRCQVGSITLLFLFVCVFGRFWSLLVVCVRFRSFAIDFVRCVRSFAVVCGRQKVFALKAVQSVRKCCQVGSITLFRFCFVNCHLPLLPKKLTLFSFLIIHNLTLPGDKLSDVGIYDFLTSAYQVHSLFLPMFFSFLS
jgi:hypothetical protein